MFRKVARNTLAFVLTLAAAIGGVSVPAQAGEEKGMCNENHDRGTIPNDFPLDACFDGKTLYVKNGTQFPLVLTVTGDSVGRPERYKQGMVSGASGLMSYIRPGDFGLMPPGYYIKVNVGNDAAKVRIGTASSGLQKMYVISELIWQFLPTEVPVELLKVIAELVKELSEVGAQYVACRERNNAWGDVGCSALLGRNVPFAFGRAAIKGLGSGVIKSVISLFDTAKWADAASGDLIKLKDGTRDFTIAANKPPSEPTRDNPPANGGSETKPGGGTGNSGGGHNPPPPPNNPPPPPPPTSTATVQNMHLEGAYGLGEDSTPSYLSTVMQPRCASNGCKIGGTDMWSGATFKTICRSTGALMTNENRNTQSDDNNPHLIETDQWLYGERNGHTGYISYIYLTPASRNLNIPRC